MNKVTLLGRLGKDIEIKTFDNGGKIGNATMATSKKYKDREGNLVEKTQWHNLKFVNCPDVLTKVGKGCRALVEGEIEYREYTDKDGNKRIISEIVCLGFEIIDWKDSNNSQPQQNQEQEDLAF